jgi:hypothetical protein
MMQFLTNPPTPVHHPTSLAAQQGVEPASESIQMSSVVLCFAIVLAGLWGRM